MADSAVPLNTNGSVSLRDNGAVILGDPSSLPCCCGCPGGTCAHCSGLLPNRFSLTSTGLAQTSNSGVCITDGVGGSVKYTLGPSPTFAGINVTTCLTDSFAPTCARVTQFSSTPGPTFQTYATYNAYTGSTVCTGVGSSGDFGTTWALHKFANKWVLVSNVRELSAVAWLAFYSEVSVTDPTSCYTSVEFTNQLTNVTDTTLASSPLTSLTSRKIIPVYYGGTAVVTACGC